ncbi:MAG TPA: beta-ketoacyl synthase chain length factor [Oleiagrimonas sp.]|nr:beta-ketoacyl synthase chain length factor [Oleiagrimonas sp.]
MSAQLETWIEGIGVWSPGLVDWAAWRTLLQGTGTKDDTAPAKPRPSCLAAGERRRVSVHVLAAIEVASQAVAMSGRDGSDLPCIFASANGDTGIMDYICATLADTPQHLSPTRFHNSVHNAAAGYWTIATDNHAASQAVTAGETTFAAGLLEAAVQATVEDHPILLVAHDDPGSGPLREVMAVQQPFACALLLSPRASSSAAARMRLACGAAVADEDLPQQPLAAALARGNPAARGLALLEALAMRTTTQVTLAAAPHMGLTVDIESASP